MIRIIIVDDHAIVRQGLRQLISAQPNIEIIGEATNGEDAIKITKRLKPDVILIDLLMPVMDGIQAIERISKLKMQVGILALTSALEDHFIKQAIQAGAQGYILKASNADNIVTAIMDVAAGRSALDPVVTQALIQQTRVQDPIDKLTLRERDVFEMLALGNTNFEISETLAISEATVRTHLVNILDKLSLRDRTKVVIYALQKGLVRIEDLR